MNKQDITNDLIDAIEERPINGDLEWLSKDLNHVLHNTDGIVIYLLKKVRLLENKVEQLQAESK